jgi:hypothetical protein
MDWTKQGVIYAVLVIPVLLAVSVFVQGITQLSKDNEKGRMGIGFGIFLFVLIILAYIFFIR